MPYIQYKIQREKCSSSSRSSITIKLLPFDPGAIRVECFGSRDREKRNYVTLRMFIRHLTRKRHINDPHRIREKSLASIAVFYRKGKKGAKEEEAVPDITK